MHGEGEQPVNRGVWRVEEIPRPPGAWAAPGRGAPVAARTCAAKKEMDMAGYDIQQMGDATEISTTPEAVPAPWLLVAIPGTLLVLIALSMSFFGGLIAAGFVYGAMYLLMHSKQATQYRVPARFRVSKTGIEVNGNSIPKDAIHRVIIRNHVLKAAGDVIVVPIRT